MTPPLQRGDFVRLTNPASGQTLRAMVTLASPNGRSVIVMFDGMMDGWVGSMPLSEDEAGAWTSLNGMPVTVERTARES